MNADKVKQEIPAVELLGSPELREAVVRTWVAALERGGHESIADAPQSWTVPGRDLLAHVNEVVEIALVLIDISQSRFGLAPDRDVALAAVILHDVDKAFIQRRDASGKVSYLNGYTVRQHGPLGADLAVACGVPADIADLVRWHAPFGYDGHLPGTVEGTLVHYSDLLAADLAAVQYGSAPLHVLSLMIKRSHPLLHDLSALDEY